MSCYQYLFFVSLPQTEGRRDDRVEVQFIRNAFQPVHPLVPDLKEQRERGKGALARDVCVK